MMQTPISRFTPRREKQASRFIVILIISVILTNVLAIIYAVSTLYSSRGESVLAAETRSRTIARALDQTITSNVNKIDIALQILTHETEAQLTQGALKPDILVQNLRHLQLMLPESAGGRVFDASGRLIAAIGTPANPQLNISQRSYFLEPKAVSDDRLYISRPIFSLFSHQWAVLFSRRYNDNKGNFAGVVIVPVKIDYFSQLMQHFDLDSSDSTMLRYSDLSLIASYPPRLENVKSDGGSLDVSLDLQKIASSGVMESVFDSITPSDQVKRINTFHRVNNAPFIIIADVAEKDFLQPWYRQVWQTVSFLSLFLLLSLFLVGLVVHYWRKQLYALTSLSDSLDQLDSAQAVGRLGTYTYDFSQDQGMGSASLYAIIGLTPGSNLSIVMLQDIIYPEDQNEVRLRFGRALQARESDFSIEYRIIRKTDGELCWVADLAKIEYSPDGTMLRMTGVIQDVGERKRAEERLRLTQEVFLHTSEGIYVTDSQGRFLEINPAFTQISGYRLEDVADKTPRILDPGLYPETFLQQRWQQLLQTGHWEGEQLCCRKDGSRYTQYSRISSVRDSQGNISRFICMASNITELREMQSRIEYLAYFDKLTELPNRASFIDNLQQAVNTLNPENESLGVCYLDLDEFKQVNDEWGHQAGDDILRQVARRLTECAKEDDLVARIGGDDFVLLLMHLHDEHALQDAITRLHNAFIDPFVVEQLSAKLTISIGATLYPRDGGDTPEALIRNANQAMYIAKLNGKNRSHLFDIVNERHIRENHTLLARVLKAYEQNEFQLYYQPKVNMHTGEVIGAEALIRWIHPQQGMIPPDVFLPLVENTEFSVVLGEWVTRQALQQMGAWAAEGLVLPVSINISGYHLQQADFVRRLAQILSEYPQVPADWLELEILETTAMEDLDRIAHLLDDCMKLGVHFALDDFGTGYSSLTYLRRLPTQTMKIDRSFVIDMLSNSMDHALVAGIVGLGKSLDREVIAEGVESLEHGIPLLRMGCYLAQGYGIARPMSADKVQEWVAQWQMPAIWQNY